jgi:hypothetical protein
MIVFARGKSLIRVALCLFISAAWQINAQQPTPVLLLQADQSVTADADGNVTLWGDKSGKQNDASQSDTTLTPKLVVDAVNGKPAIRFDGANDYLDVASSDSLNLVGDVSAFFVVRFDDFANYRAVFGKTAGSQPAPLDYYLVPGTGLASLWRGDGSALDSANLPSTRAVKANTWAVMGFVISGNTATHYLNGQVVGSGDLAGVPGDGGTLLKVGTRDDFVTKMKGDIAELVIYNGALTGADLDNAINGLRTKYGILNEPPTVTIQVEPAGPTVPVGTTLTITATPVDVDGTIDRVQFLLNGSVFVTASQAPYSTKIRLDTAGSYDFSAIATDDKGAVGASAVTTITAGPASAPALTVKGNLQVWLEADQGVTASASGAVTAWADQSGQNNNAAQPDEGSAPVLVPNVINGKPTLHFEDVPNYLDIADSDTLNLAGDITSLFVVRVDDLTGYNEVWGKTAGPGGNLPAPDDFYTLPGSGVPRFFRGDGANSNGFSDGAAWQPGVFELAGFGAAGTAVSHFLNGSVSGTGTIAAQLADGDTALRIGSREDRFTKLKGDLAELLIYDAALSDTDRRSVELYLAGKYGLALTTPLNTLPTVKITAPANGLSVEAPASVTVTADASDADGSIASVDFYVNGSKVTSATKAPYSAVLNFPAADQAIITAVAVDNLGGRTTSDPVTVTITTKVILPLPAPGSLKLWLAADKGVKSDSATGAVSEWDDSSGNNNNALQTDLGTAPTLVADALNGKPVIRFNGDQDELRIESSPSIAITGDISTFFVVNFTDFTTYRAVWAKTANNEPRPSDYYTLPNSGIPNVYRGGSGGIASVTATDPVPAATYIITGWDMVGPTVTHYLDNAIIGTGNITVTPTDSGDPVFIGTRSDQFTRMFGDIAEIIIYSRGLTEAERNQVHDYLRKKYGLGPVQGPGLSVSVSNNTLVISWDSSAAGFDLESSDKVNGPYTKVTEPIVPNGNNNTVSVPLTGQARFFRLRSP